MLVPCGARTWSVWVGSLRRDVTNKLEAGLLLVEAEPMGDRGRLSATGDPQLGQDP